MNPLSRNSNNDNPKKPSLFGNAHLRQAGIAVKAKNTKGGIVRSLDAVEDFFWTEMDGGVLDDFYRLSELSLDQSRLPIVERSYRVPFPFAKYHNRHRTDGLPPQQIVSYSSRPAISKFPPE